MTAKTILDTVFVGSGIFLIGYGLALLFFYAETKQHTGQRVSTHRLTILSLLLLAHSVLSFLYFGWWGAAFLVMFLYCAVYLYDKLEWWRYDREMERAFPGYLASRKDKP